MRALLALVVFAALVVASWAIGLAVLWSVLTAGLWLQANLTATRFVVAVADVVMLAMLAKAVAMLVATLRDPEQVQR